uniref:Uncharacterized protein n=1 Tax=Odontella aurita TaxID=265563 RepID=A0A7S4IG64_9STRA|mmetsp:Transcript_24756/g.72496  ORF Transcript_24756/g.72496 Transcript_24756/m.72496 type:complete len:236 (+) Transcript_24756:114-821(+)
MEDRVVNEESSLPPPTNPYYAAACAREDRALVAEASNTTVRPDGTRLIVKKRTYDDGSIDVVTEEHEEDGVIKTTNSFSGDIAQGVPAHAVGTTDQSQDDSIPTAAAVHIPDELQTDVGSSSDPGPQHVHAVAVPTNSDAQHQSQTSFFPSLLPAPWSSISIVPVQPAAGPIVTTAQAGPQPERKKFCSYAVAAVVIGIIFLVLSAFFPPLFVASVISFIISIVLCCCACCSGDS